MPHFLWFFADSVPPNIWHSLGSTTIAFVPCLLTFGATALYLLGVWRFNRLYPDERWSRLRTTAFLGGTLVTFAAIQLVVGVYDDVLFYDHMIQHLMLIMVASPLYAMGAPIELLERATTGRTHGIVRRLLSSTVAEVVGHPITGLVLYAVLIPVAHLTSLYNFTLTHDLAHDNEHLAFILIGYLFWRPVVAIEPSRHPLQPGLRLVYLALAIPIDTFSGVALVSTSHEVFPYYNTFHRTWGPSLVADLHLGGSIMWAGGDTLMAIAMAPVAVQWLHHEEQRAIEIDRELDLAAQMDAMGDQSIS